MDHDLLLTSRRLATCLVDFDWVLVDKNGCVALCCSSADGEIPDVVLEIDERQQGAFQDTVAALPQRLPILGGVQEENGGMGWDVASPEFAKRGFFVFDWKPWHGPYRRVLVPTQPVNGDAVKAQMDAFRDYVPAVDVSFAAIKSFHLPDLLRCR